jgi:signal peptidase II
MKGKRVGKPGIVFTISFWVVVLDQLTKFLAYSNISQSIPIIGGIFHLTLVKNTGAGFGILQGQQWLLVFISIFVVGLILFYYDKIPKKGLAKAWVAMLLGGTIGNLIDRIRLGFVIDFLDFRIWPAFNIADSAITIGAIGLIFYLMREK